LNCEKPVGFVRGEAEAVEGVGLAFDAGCAPFAIGGRKDIEAAAVAFGEEFVNHAPVVLGVDFGEDVGGEDGAHVLGLDVDEGVAGPAPGMDAGFEVWVGWLEAELGDGVRGEETSADEGAEADEGKGCGVTRDGNGVGADHRVIVHELDESVGVGAGVGAVDGALPGALTEGEAVLGVRRGVCGEDHAGMPFEESVQIGVGVGLGVKRFAGHAVIRWG